MDPRLPDDTPADVRRQFEEYVKAEQKRHDAEMSKIDKAYQEKKAAKQQQIAAIKQDDRYKARIRQLAVDNAEKKTQGIVNNVENSGKRLAESTGRLAEKVQELRESEATILAQSRKETSENMARYNKLREQGQNRASKEGDEVRACYDHILAEEKTRLAAEVERVAAGMYREDHGEDQ
ncbi:hypothetical protein LTR10_013449 [Elasticomyces elasticus]|uniref:Phosphoserine phosphatase n=1 Tax=Exophiala sideris TaxID=1016849 RepID=A0ABR0J5T5_9EURO|nr:hypothetical protein LTR10_013449 [Elasticomyces elasticus]KAK5027321.1 hypothetical protein LTS07_006923 [Exophiala sideris]KAK5034977.1 hypothetical protein LTR13_006159 [Exophiala sideris]KAK5056289.1 hypothetical protein LTR69_007830 [Exophiala sideris]KAK5181222.1 hypothetical protein LTR44_006553 [Eurotiomycetes sp. CCFEE 6388]